MDPQVGSPARYRFEDRVLFLFVPLVFLVVLLQFSLGHFHLHPTRIWAVLYAAAVSSPVIAYIFSLGLYLSEEKDEFQRALLVQSILWGVGVTACVAFFWFALGTFTHVPHLNFLSGEILFLLAFVASFWVNRWRYR
jgi:hypothetical protein